MGVLQPLRAGGPLPPRAPIGEVTADSREAGAGSLFVALPGERVDGADFLGEAFRNGALAAVVGEEGARKVPPELFGERPIFVVRNALEALGDLARAHRERFRHVPLAGITGSSGKTTTKEMLCAFLSRGRRVLKNPGNRNNLIGMPLSLLGLSGEHDAAVLEMGTNRPGEIRRLCEIAQPDVGIVTNIGPAHLEGLVSLEGVAREKGDLFRSLGPGGIAVVNATDLRVVREATRSPAAKVYYGAPMSEFAGRILSQEDGGMRIAIRTPSGEFRTFLPVPGEHNLQNAVAAAAAAYTLGSRPPEMADGLAELPGVPGRLRPVPLRGGGLLLDDTYNANPASMEAAIRSLQSLRRGRRAVAVLGDMRELGPVSPSAHYRIGRLLPAAGVDVLFTHGEQAAHIARGALEAGMDPEAVMHIGEKAVLVGEVLAAIREGDILLVKASRGMRLEEVSEAVERRERA